MKNRLALLLVLGAPFAAACGVVLGVEDRTVAPPPDAAILPSDAATATDGPLVDGARADAEAPLDASKADADASVLDPKSLAGLELWYDGDRGIAENGAEVASWEDQSGKSRHLVRGLAAQPSIQKKKFPGTVHDATSFAPGAPADPSGYLTATGFTLAQPLTIAVAVYPTLADAGFYDIILGGLAAPTLGIGRFGAFQSSAGAGATYTNLPAPNSWTVGPHIVVAVFNGPSSSFRVDGQTITGTLTNAPLEQGIFLSQNGAPFHGYIGEILVYSRSLGAAEQSAVHAYLSARYVP